MAKDVAVNGALAAEVRRLAGLRTSRAAVESLMREFVRQRTDNGADDGNGQAADNGAVETDAAQEFRGDRQAEFLQKTAAAIARGGDPFYPGFDHKKLRKAGGAKLRKLHRQMP